MYTKCTPAYKLKLVSYQYVRISLCHSNTIYIKNVFQAKLYYMLCKDDDFIMSCAPPKMMTMTLLHVTQKPAVALMSPP